MMILIGVYFKQMIRMSRWSLLNKDGVGMAQLDKYSVGTAHPTALDSRFRGNDRGRQDAGGTVCGNDTLSFKRICYESVGIVIMFFVLAGDECGCGGCGLSGGVQGQ